MTDLTQMTQSWDGDLTAGTNSTFFPNYATSRGRRPLTRQIKLFLAIRDYLVKHQVKMVMLHGYNDVTRYLILRWCNRKNIRVALTADSNIFKEGRLNTIKAIIKRLYLRHIMKRLDAILPCGTAGKAYFRAYLDHDLPCVIFPFEPDYKNFNLTAEDIYEHKKSNGLSTEKRYIIFCGRLIQLKRLDIALGAFKEIAMDRENWEFLIVGEGPEETRLKKIIPPELSNRVHWIGFAQNRELALWYHSSDLLILASEHDAWGLVVNEALAAGLAVICTDVVGASVDLVAEGVNGFTFPPRDTCTLINCLNKATKDNKIDQLKQGSKEVLDAWRVNHDPVSSVRQVLLKFNLI
jgi:glycosyltransferase involved in cell wall biosynthesis